MRPLFIDSLSPTDSPLWPPPVWQPRSEVDARPGTFMFTSDGLFAGLVVEMRGRTVTPASTPSSAAGGNSDENVVLLIALATGAVVIAVGLVVLWAHL